jgi:hypothetical protein
VIAFKRGEDGEFQYECNCCADGGKHAVDMGMMLQSLVPGMEHVEEADLRAEVMRIAGDLQQGKSEVARSSKCTDWCAQKCLTLPTLLETRCYNNYRNPALDQRQKPIRCAGTRAPKAGLYQRCNPKRQNRVLSQFDSWVLRGDNFASTSSGII